MIIESKVAEDGGTARDKAARIKNASEAAKARGLLPCAVIDGKGWSERLRRFWISSSPPTAAPTPSPPLPTCSTFPKSPTSTPL